MCFFAAVNTAAVTNQLHHEGEFYGRISADIIPAHIAFSEDVPKYAAHPPEAPWIESKMIK